MWQRSVEEHGFALIPDVLGEQDISRLSEDLADAQLRRSRAGVRHALKHPAVARIAEDLRLLDIARGVLGAGAVPYRATLFDKSPESNWLVVWHQDTALPLRRRQETRGWGPWSVKDGVIYAHAPASALDQVLALRVHLDDSTAENGPLRVLPGTHRQDVLSDEAIQALAATLLDSKGWSRGDETTARPRIFEIAIRKPTSRATHRICGLLGHRRRA